ncbi:hypothetical protein XI04_03215 [Bradyrhizobium sp. CCBAU 11430]|nr:hypothetical protein [Bradyrhizobium sp. CCBAU 11430]
MSLTFAFKSPQLLRRATGENRKSARKSVLTCSQLSNFLPYRGIAILWRIKIVARNQKRDRGPNGILESARYEMGIRFYKIDRLDLPIS